MWAPRKRMVRVQPPPLVQRSCDANATTIVQKTRSTISAGWSYQLFNSSFHRKASFLHYRILGWCSQEHILGSRAYLPYFSKLCLSELLNPILPWKVVLKSFFHQTSLVHINRECRSQGPCQGAETNYFLSKDLSPQINKCNSRSCQMCRGFCLF